MNILKGSACSRTHFIITHHNQMKIRLQHTFLSQITRVYASSSSSYWLYLSPSSVILTMIFCHTHIVKWYSYSKGVTTDINPAWNSSRIAFCGRRWVVGKCQPSICLLYCFLHCNEVHIMGFVLLSANVSARWSDQRYSSNFPT